MCARSRCLMLSSPLSDAPHRRDLHHPDRASRQPVRRQGQAAQRRPHVRPRRCRPVHDRARPRVRAPRGAPRAGAGGEARRAHPRESRCSLTTYRAAARLRVTSRQSPRPFTPAPPTRAQTGPFIDADHPLIKRGEVDEFPSQLFRTRISAKLAHLVANSPRTSVLLVPHGRDLTSTHVAFPQAPLVKEAELGLPKVRSQLAVRLLRAMSAKLSSRAKVSWPT